MNNDHSGENESWHSIHFKEHYGPDNQHVSIANHIVLSPNLHIFGANLYAKVQF